MFSAREGIFGCVLLSNKPRPKQCNNTEVAHINLEILSVRNIDCSEVFNFWCLIIWLLTDYS